MKIKERIERSWQFIKLVFNVAQSVDIAEIQRKYGFNKQRYIRMHFVDIGKNYTFRIVSGKLKLVIKPVKPDVEIYVSSLCVFKHLRLGYKKGYDPSTGKPIKVKYSPFDAWKFGDISFIGDASTNDAIASANLFIDLVACIPEDKVVNVIGACEHDI